MYDYLKAKQQIKGLVNIDTSNLKRIEVEMFGFQKYQLEYRKPIDIWYNKCTNELRIEGSIPYFWQGHNYNQSEQSFKSAINFISTMMGVDLWDAKVVKFEYGKTILTDQIAENVLHNHLAIGRKKPGRNGECKFFDDKGDAIKLYDAVHNYKNKVPVEIRQNQMQDAGMVKGAKYVRFEKRYVNPSRFFGYDIVIRDLISPYINNWCRRDLYRSYKRIRINPGINIPDTKKQLSSTAIAVIALKQAIAQAGLDTDAKSLIWGVIKNTQCLNVNDKKARKTQLIKALNACSIDKGRYDLSTTLIRKLAADRF